MWSRTVLRAEALRDGTPVRTRGESQERLHWPKHQPQELHHRRVVVVVVVCFPGKAFVCSHHRGASDQEDKPKTERERDHLLEIMKKWVTTTSSTHFLSERLLVVGCHHTPVSSYLALSHVLDPDETTHTHTHTGYCGFTICHNTHTKLLPPNGTQTQSNVAKRPDLNHVRCFETLLHHI